MMTETGKHRRIGSGILLVASMLILSVPLCGIGSSDLQLDQMKMPNFVRNTLLWSYAWSLLGLTYRLFESRNSEYSPWVAYLFSYPIRLIVSTLFVSTVVVALCFSLKLPGLLVFGLSGPLCFLFGHNPELERIFRFIENKKG